MSAFYIPMMISNMAAGTISMKTGFRGANFDITTACATGTHSIGEAFRKIKDGYLDACLAGGTESTGVEFTFGGGLFASRVLGLVLEWRLLQEAGRQEKRHGG